MKIIIVGIGKLGEYLAKNLVKESHEVTIVDLDFSRCQDIINNEDLNYLNGNGLDANVLIEAGIKDSDLLISVMEQDEHNMICCLLGKKLGAKHTIARIRTPEYSSSTEILKEELGLSMTINPERLTANYIARILSIPSALDATVFFKGRIQMISVKVKHKGILEGLTINSLSNKINGKIIICAIEKNNEIVIPKGNTKIQENDILHITGTRKDINDFLKFAKISEQTKKVIISGGSNTALYLAKTLNEMDMETKIIEINEERCEILSEKLPNSLIINGDSSDQNILYEEELDKCDAFVSLNSIDEENIILSMFASMNKVPKIITKVNHINLDGIIETANVGTIITPHKIATHQIVKYVRAMQNSEASSCESIYKFDNDKFSILEFKIKNDFKKLNTKIKNIKLHDGILIIAILRNDKIIFPSGNDEIKIKDTIVVIDKDSKILDINDILE
ncbi:MAG: Trk system potassium transporter TrkA [Candidatus Coprovivens sp.]